MINKKLITRVKYLHEEIDNERISYSEIVEIDNIAKELGIHIDEENMTSSDVLIAIEEKIMEDKINA